VVPCDPPVKRFDPTPPTAADKSINAPRFDPPLSKIRTLFCHTSIVTLVEIVVFVAGLFRVISPPSSPEEKLLTKFCPAVTLPVADKDVNAPVDGVVPPIGVLLTVLSVSVLFVKVSVAEDAPNNCITFDESLKYSFPSA